MPTHKYGLDIKSSDPQADQPDKILVPLKPHQLAALHKAIVLEKEGTINYDTQCEDVITEDPFAYHNYGRRATPLQRRFLQMRTNIGVLADIVGYGKTLTALSIIASTKTTDIVREQQRAYSFGGFGTRSMAQSTYVMDRMITTPDDNFIQTTLIVVPRGPVYVQWKNAISSQTSLKCLDIGDLPQIRRNLPLHGSDARTLKTYFEDYDIVLVKNTALKTLMDYYSMMDHPITAWSRIIVDECHDIVNKVPLFDFRFLWLMSGTWTAIPHRIHGSRNSMALGLRDVLCETRLKFLLIRGQPEFVRSSFEVPEPVDKYYLCNLPRQFHAVQPFLSRQVMERVNANDIAGAITEMGGNSETEADVVELVTKTLQRDLANKVREVAYINGLDLGDTDKAQLLERANQELQRIQDKIETLKQRVTDLAIKTCAICYDNFKNPVILPCTHVFCGSCLIRWCSSGVGIRACPECRAPIRSESLIAIVDQKTSQQPQQLLSKEDTVFKILQDNPEGKFLIFSRLDGCFFSIAERLKQLDISFAEVKGTTGVMMHIIDRFKRGEIRVLLLNTFHAGSGIDLSCATDVIAMYNMGDDGVQAIGRAQRVGRTSRLNIHRLVFSHETHPDTPIST